MTEIVIRDGRVRRRLHGPRWRSVVAGLRAPRGFLRALGARLQRHRTVIVAAAMTYYFFFALFPLVLFLVALASMLPFPELEAWLLTTIGAAVPAEARGMLDETIHGILAQPRSGLLSLGAVLALWGASAAFAAMIDALNGAYEVEEGRPWWRARLLAVGLTLALAAIMVLTFAIGLAGERIAAALAGSVGRPPGLAVVLARAVLPAVVVTATVGLIYYVGPDVEQHWRWVTPGALLFTLASGAASTAFGYYLASFGAYDRTYGALGAVIILMLWMYMLAVFLLVGAEVNALLEHVAPEGKQPGAKEEPTASRPPDEPRRALRA